MSLKKGLLHNGSKYSSKLFFIGLIELMVDFLLKTNNNFVALSQMSVKNKDE